MRAPLASAAVSVAVLVALAIPVLDFETGLPGIRTLPDRFPSKQGFLALEESFGVGTVDDVQVVVEGDVGSPSLGAREDRGRSARTGSSGTSKSTSPTTAGGDRRGARGRRQPRLTRARLGRGSPRGAVPEALGALDAVALVTGETAETIDYRELTSRWLPIVFAFVLGLSSSFWPSPSARSSCPSSRSS